MRHARAASIAAAALLAGCAAPLLGAEIEVPSVRIASPVQTITPPAGPPPPDLCEVVPGACVPVAAAFDFAADVPFVTEKGVTVELRLKEFALHLRPANDGLLGFQVVVIDPRTGTAHVLASWQKGADPVPEDIVVPGNSGIDLGPFLTGGRLDARVEVTFDPTPPPAAFEAWAEADFSASVTVDYADLF